MKRHHFIPNAILVIVATCLSACGGGGGSAKTTTPPAAQNISPTIAALSAESVMERASFSITATASDSDGSISGYQWQQTAGTDVTNLVVDGATLTFDAPNISSDETISFSLTVTDNRNATATASLDIPLVAYEAIELAQFKDLGLVECLREKGDIDLSTFSIKCDSFVIKSLSDLASFTSLESLSITNAKLIDTSGLEDLRKLKYLNLSSNLINETEIFNSLTKLVSLDLSNNFLDENHLDLSNLLALKELDLSIENSRLSSIDIEKLNINLTIESLKINNLSMYGGNSEVLSRFTKLEHLEMANVILYNTDSSSSLLLNLPSLKHLVIKNSNSVDLSSIRGLTKLEYLDASNTSGNSEFDLSVLSELTTLKSLYLNFNRQTTNIGALANLTLLETLSFYSSNISSIAFLSSHKDLKSLNIKDNRRLTDISVLSNATNLEELNLARLSLLSDISPLTNLLKLRTLDMEEIYQSGVDLTPLKNLIALESLNLSRNSNLTTISALDGLTELKTLNLKKSTLVKLPNFSLLKSLENLNISNSILSNFDDLQGATSVKNLAAEDIINLENIDGLADFHNLESIDLSGASRVTNVSALTNKPLLKELDLSSMSKLENIDALTELNSPTTINLFGNSHIPCVDLEQLENTFSEASIRRPQNCLVKKINRNLIADFSLLNCIGSEVFDADDVTQISCNYYQIDSLEGIEQFYNLEGLSLYNNNVSNLAPIRNLTKLTSLNLFNNDVTSISNLSKLTKLNFLDLRNNAITSVAALSNLKALESLSLSNNQISNVTPLASLPILRSLTISNNSITNISDLLELPNLNRLEIDGNNISDFSNVSSFSNLRYWYVRENDVVTCEHLEEISASLNLYSFLQPSRCN